MCTLVCRKAIITLAELSLVMTTFQHLSQKPCYIEWPDPPFPLLVMQYIPVLGKGVVWFTRLMLPGFLSGGSWKLEAGSWLPPLGRPTSHILNYIDIVVLHDIVESFPLLMAKAVLNEYFTLLNFRTPRRRKQSLSLSVCYLSSSIHVQAPCIHCVVDLSL